MITFSWERLERLDAAVAWHRDPENAPLANIWHTENVAELAASLRELMRERETDAHLIAVLWSQVPGDERGDLIDRLQDPRSPHADTAARLAEVIEETRRAD